MSQEPSHETESIAERWARQLEAWGREVEDGGSPLIAWQALRVCRMAGLPLPLWVSDYLDRVANTLVRGPFNPDSYNYDAERWQDYVVTALEFKSNRGGGPSNPWEAWSKTLDHVFWRHASGSRSTAMG